MSINISERVIELLESEKGKSQNDLALEIGLAPSVISKIKTGRSQDPSAETVAALAKYFNVSADWILGLTDVKSTDKATKDLCSTLGLSEKAISVLSGDLVIGKYSTGNVIYDSPIMKFEFDDSLELDIEQKIPERIKEDRTQAMRQEINVLLEEYAECLFKDEAMCSLLYLLIGFKYSISSECKNLMETLKNQLLAIGVDSEDVDSVFNNDYRSSSFIQEITAYLVNKKREAEGNNGNDTKA